MNKDRTNSRAVAAEIIGRWLRTDDFPDRLVEETAAGRAFVMEVVHGVAKLKRALEWVIARQVKGKAERRAIPYLFVGLYQILFMDTVADYAAVDETVKAVKARHAQRIAGFVNGVLRAALREKESLKAELGKAELGTRESHPDVVVSRWLKLYGRQRTSDLCRWNNTRPPVVIHPNATKISMQDFEISLKKAGIEADRHPFSPDEFLALPHGIHVKDVPGYNAGLFSVHDPSTISAVRLLDPQPGETVLDACASPGGKTILIAERMRNTGQIVAMDAHEDRLARLAENLKRMRLGTVRTVRADATSRKDMERALGDLRFDRILLDVPCTNTGVFRRRPDARWRFSLKRLKDLTRVQCSMLDCVASFLKPGGTLVYSTCSLEPEECGTVVVHWVKKHRNFKLARIVETFPPETQTDGSFAAAMTKAAVPQRNGTVVVTK